MGASPNLLKGHDVDHQADHYSDAYIRGILKETKVIALVGASANWNRPSYFASKYLQKRGFRVIPVNPRYAGDAILGETVYASVTDIPLQIDMVDVFRPATAVPPILEEAIAANAKTLWLQLGVVHQEAAERAEVAGLRVVMNRCPKIEYARLSGELSWNGINSRVITAKKKAI